ncbi:hypothetical protein V1514DRAFT_339461 [Lipomyces japonicus]|uniref:uncharacterized protein n=1 Tax=Lipomyces japonicus TaxID=56871 RepID=UPI0034CF22C7
MLFTCAGKTWQSCAYIYGVSFAFFGCMFLITNSLRSTLVDRELPSLHLVEVWCTLLSQCTYFIYLVFN